MSLNTYTLSEVVEMVATATQLPAETIFHRVTNFVKKNYMAGENVRGSGTGMRRDYFRLSVYEATVLCLASEIVTGETLRYVATVVRMGIRDIEREVKAKGKTVWIILDRSKRMPVHQPILDSWSMAEESKKIQKYLGDCGGKVCFLRIDEALKRLPV